MNRFETLLSHENFFLIHSILLGNTLPMSIRLYESTTISHDNQRYIVFEVYSPGDMGKDGVEVSNDIEKWISEYALPKISKMSGKEVGLGRRTGYFEDPLCPGNRHMWRCYAEMPASVSETTLAEFTQSCVGKLLQSSRSVAKFARSGIHRTRSGMSMASDLQVDYGVPRPLYPMRDSRPDFSGSW